MRRSESITVGLKGLEQSTKSRATSELAGDNLATWATFRNEVDRSVVLLRQVRLQMTLFAIRPAGSPDTATINAIASALARLGSVGWLADGRIGFLYMGPRALGHGGDSALMRHIRTAIEDGLNECEITFPREWIEIAASHGWTDEIGGVDELARPLFERRDRHSKAIVIPFVRIAR